MNGSVIFLMGPTASGKTALAEQLHEIFPCEIISVDSALVYRGMDIGTAKPDSDFLAKTPHHLIDIRDPLEIYSAADFRQDALRLIAEILARGKVPLLVGGTMLYFKVLRDGIASMPKTDPAVRRYFEERSEKEGLAVLHRELEQLDPVAAARIHPNDPQRLLRALEVHAMSGRSLSAWHATQSPEQGLPYRVLPIAVAPGQRAVLHERIELRFHQMLAQGLLDEVKRLYARGDLSSDLPAMRAVGYRQVWQYLEGDYDYAQMVNRAIIATRQLAKRQLTWLRSWPGVVWFESDDQLLLTRVRQTIAGFIAQGN